MSGDRRRGFRPAPRTGGEPSWSASRPLLELRGVEVEFKTRDGTARVLDRVDFALSAGATLGIVGESGCGKSMTALTIMRLVPQPPGRIAGGSILLDGEDLLAAGEERMREIRGNEVSMVFQEPMTSLNPVFPVGEQIAETVRLHQGLGKREALERAVEMLAAVGIPAPERRVGEYPHQLSGGMRQRVMIAIALACGPRVMIADEPTTALDVTVQAQIFDLLLDLRERTGTSIILITHDMGAIAEMADRVVVMYAGRIVEEGPVGVILDEPLHPYTRGLIACVPHLEEHPSPERRPLSEIAGMVPALTALGHGCAFAPRCAHAMDRCRERAPPLGGESGHRVACWLHEEGDRSGVPPPSARADRRRTHGGPPGEAGRSGASPLPADPEAGHRRSSGEAEASWRPAGTGTPPTGGNLLEIHDLKVHFDLPRRVPWGARSRVHAVDGVSFDVPEGTTFGLVGESGSGKSTTALAVMRLVEITGGRIRLGGTALGELEDEALRLARRDFQIIFQDPYSSLDPRTRAGAMVREPLDLMEVGAAAERDDRVAELFTEVGLRPEQRFLFPHQFSGGQRQRIGVARALATHPRLVVCDEPVSALDVAIQAQILNLLQRLQRERALTYLFISHDLGVVQYVCDEIAVMYLGRIVEQADRVSLFTTPLHPYTWALLSAVPSARARADRAASRRIRLTGDPPSPIDPPPGCRFAGRCPFAEARCRREAPRLRAIRNNHRVACHLVGDDGSAPHHAHAR